jgi:hypothetical protein
MEAETKCRRLRMGKVHWSPEFAILQLNMKYWCLALRIRMGKSIDKKFFLRIARQVQLPTNVPENTNQIQLQIETHKELIKNYKKSIPCGYVQPNGVGTNAMSRRI